MFCQKEITLEEQCTVKFVPFFWGISRRPIAIASGIWYNKRTKINIGKGAHQNVYGNR